MAATSFQTHGLGQQGKIAKSRARTSVKPILKKLHSSSHSEKNSLDLDRGWDDQQSPHLGYVAPDYSHGAGRTGSMKHHYTSDDTGRLFGSSYPTGAAAGSAGRSARDVSFDLAAVDLSKAGPGGPGGSGLAATTTNSTTVSTVNSASATSGSTSNHFSHVRSTSGVSNISTATSASGGRNGSFVHPFQQTPRTSTPPLLSYANSVNSLENNAQRDYSPTITEKDDESIDPLALPNPAAARPLQPTLPQSHANSGYRRPSLTAGHRTNSLSDVATPLRGVSTTRNNSATVPRSVAYSASAAVNQGRLSDVQVGTSSSITVIDDSSIGPDTVGRSSPQISGSQPASGSPMSPLRHSLDMNHFRIRSRSDVDTATRQEHVREARRKFEEKERAKEEKYAREQVRKRERADTREAHRQDRAQSRKGSLNTVGRASSSDVRPEATRRSTGHGRPIAEKVTPGNDFTSRGYDDMTTGQSPGRADEVRFESNKRTRMTAKRKTTGAWTTFMLWLRTRLVKLGRR